MTAPQIHLASKSPRRQQLLRQLGIDFDVLKLREAAGRDRDIVEGAHSDGRLVGLIHLPVYDEGDDLVGELGVSVDPESRQRHIATRLAVRLKEGRRMSSTSARPASMIRP